VGQGIAWFCVVLAVLHSSAAIAGTYQLTLGQGRDVCETYRKNLTPHRETTPMACERQYDPALPGFTAPRWQPLDWRTHLELLSKARIYLQEHNSFVTAMKLSDAEVERDTPEHLKGWAQMNHVELRTADLDLVGDGKRWKVLAMSEDGCGAHRLPGSRITRLFILNGAGTDIDTTVPRSWNDYYNATVELYRGQPYVEFYAADDNWGKLLTGAGELDILRFTPAGVARVCALSWKP
jgi:hypothetical protein